MKPSFVTKVSPSLGIQFAVEANFTTPRIGNKAMIKKAIAQKPVVTLIQRKSKKSGRQLKVSNIQQ